MLKRRSRLAPSPTGSLHLGNACSFLINWALAKQHNWELLFRLEDIDGPRKKIETMQESQNILRWLGLDWDGPVQLQSEGISHSKQALELLIKQDKAYHCTLSRAQFELASSAPHDDDTTKPQAQRPSNIQEHNKQSVEGENWRFVSSGVQQRINDVVQGNVQKRNDTDFVLWTKANMPSYQLAVVVDDHRQGITDVVRGRDLLESASWQEELYRALGWKPPNWWHLPLVVGEDGRRLAKRHGDTRIATYKSKGVSPERIIGLFGAWCGIQTSLSPMKANKFSEELQLKELPKEKITFTSKEEQWLLEY